MLLTRTLVLVCLGGLAAGCGEGEGTPEQELGPRNEACAGGDLRLAPAPILLGDLRAVPIDIERIDAKVVLDAAARSASAEVTLRFTMGVHDGHPVFDLRQELSSAELNGAPVDPASMASHPFPDGDTLRVIEVQLASCSQNTLVLRYPLALPSSPGARPIDFVPGAAQVSWDFWMTDLMPGRYLEMWLPANLLYDRFTLALELALTGADASHALITNGAVAALAEHHWRVAYPPTFTALSPMLLLVPEERIESYSTTLSLPDAKQVTLSLYRDRRVAADLARVAEQIAAAAAEFTRSTGTYAHGDALTVYLWTEPTRSMEYDGATTTSLEALRHELFHSWYGRGLKPANAADGWLDEAWAEYNTHPTDAFSTRAFSSGDAPVELSARSPWTRVTPGASYRSGVRFFAGLASRMGVETLVGRMGQLYAENAPGLVTTAQLERHLACASRDPEVSAAFTRYVYGGTRPQPPPDCGQ